MKKIIILIISGAALMGCTTLNKSTFSSGFDSKVQNTLKADVKVDMSKKIKGTSTNTVLFGFWEVSGPDKFADGAFVTEPGGFFSSLFGGGGDPLKAAAAYNAIKSSEKVDVIVAPQYVIERKSYLIFATTTCQVTGYPGVIQKIE